MLRLALLALLDWFIRFLLIILMLRLALLALLDWFIRFLLIIILVLRLALLALLDSTLFSLRHLVLLVVTGALVARGVQPRQDAVKLIGRGQPVAAAVLCVTDTCTTSLWCHLLTGERVPARQYTRTSVIELLGDFDVLGHAGAAGSQADTFGPAHRGEQLRVAFGCQTTPPEYRRAAHRRAAVPCNRSDWYPCAISYPVGHWTCIASCRGAR